MARSIKLDNNDFIDATAIRDTTLNKTQRELNGILINGVRYTRLWQHSARTITITSSVDMYGIIFIIHAGGPSSFGFFVSATLQNTSGLTTFGNNSGVTVAKNSGLSYTITLPSASTGYPYYVVQSILADNATISIS